MYDNNIRQYIGDRNDNRVNVQEIVIKFINDIPY